MSLNPNLRAEPFQSPQQLYQAGGFEAIRNDTEEKSQLLKSLGINVNFAPVCDVSQNPADFIYDRLRLDRTRRRPPNMCVPW